MVFRPCIDLHEGKVKQIVGGTLSDDPTTLRTNFVSAKPAAWYAELYKRDRLEGGHVIMLGPGNDTAAREALAAYPGGFHIGGGINLDNARSWLDVGASHVIVTSWAFRDGKLDFDRLRVLGAAAGKERLVLDLSCRRQNHEYQVVTDRWQRFTDLSVSQHTLEQLSAYCAEFLVHAVDLFLNQIINFGFGRQICIRSIRNLPRLGPFAGGLAIDADQRRQKRPPFADDDGFFDIG